MLSRYIKNSEDSTQHKSLEIPLNCFFKSKPAWSVELIYTTKQEKRIQTFYKPNKREEINLDNFSSGTDII